MSTFADSAVRFREARAEVWRPSPAPKAAPRDSEIEEVLENFRRQLGGNAALLMSDNYGGSERQILAKSGLEMPEAGDRGMLSGLPSRGSSAEEGSEWDDGDHLRWIPSLGHPQIVRLLCIPLVLSRQTRITAVVGFSDAAHAAGRDEIEATAARLRPFIAPYLRAWHRLRDTKRLGAGITEALDQSECGIVVLDGEGAAIFVNSVARGFVEQQDGIRINARSISPIALGDALRFQTTVNHILAEKRDRTLAFHKRSPKIMLISRSNGRRPLVATIIPIDASGTDRHDAAAVVYFIAPEQDTSRFLEAVCRLQGLSRVETRLVASLVAGKTITEAAAGMRIKSDTARAYLKQIFLKTSTRRQSDLIQFISRQLAPVVVRAEPEAII